MTKIPTGFEPVTRISPFTDLLGPIYQEADSSGLIIGLLAEDKHCNARGLIHGGVFGTLADIAMGYSAAFSTEPPTPMVTVSQVVNYVDKARKGDCITVAVAQGTINKVDSRSGLFPTDERCPPGHFHRRRLRLRRDAQARGRYQRAQQREDRLNLTM